MEKYEGLKLVKENGETVLMTKSEYLELAKQKGWDTKLPQLEDDSFDCDIFGGDDVRFDSWFSISGTLLLKNYATLEGNVSARDGIILGDNASTYDLSSDNGDIILGDNAETCELTAKNVICGDGLFTNDHNISATDGFVILGENVYVDDYYKTFATEDIICDDEPAAEARSEQRSTERTFLIFFS